MRLLSLEVEHFRAIQSAQLQFGRGLNVIYGPNDRGKSTLTEAIRAALLVAPGSAEARSFATWGATAGQFPRVVLGFESQGATWRVEKVFGPGTRAKARLEKSTDGGGRYHVHAQGRDVEGKLRELLNWGLAVPGGRGSAQRAETYLTTALLGKQGEVDAIFSASLQRDQDETGRALVTRALDALGQDPVVTRLLDKLKERYSEAYTEGGRIRRTPGSPLVRAQAALKEREDRLRDLQEAARQGKEIEEHLRRLLQERETALDERDQARARLKTLCAHAASADRREQLERAVSQHLRECERTASAVQAFEAARQEHANAQSALAAIVDEYEQAVHAADAADAAAKAARDRLVRARAAHESSEEIATTARGARIADLRAKLEKAGARRAATHTAVTAANELESLQSRLAAAQRAHDEAQEEAARAAAELNLALALEELREATVLTKAVTDAAVDHEQQTARELATGAAVAEADAALKAAAIRLENARNAEEQMRRAAEAHAMNIRVLDTRILHCEATVRDEREALDRARTAVLRVRRADEAQAAAAAAEARAAEIDASLAANAAEIARGEAGVRALESMSLGLRRRAAASKIDELTAQEAAAREHRRRAVEARDRAARHEAEAATVRLPSQQHLASLRGLHGEIKKRKAGGPTAASPAVAPALVAATGGAAAGFAAARFGGSAGTGVSIGAALLLGIVAAAIAAVLSIRRQKRNAEMAWRAEIERLESRLAAETAPVLLEAGVGALEEIESKREHVEKLHAGAEQLRRQAADLDRNADSMFESSAGLSSLRRELETLTAQVPAHDGATPAVESEVPAGGWEALNENTLRAREQIDNARRVRDQLQTERFRQLAMCASTRAAADSALAERGEVVAQYADPQAAVAEAESRWRAAEAHLSALRQERQQAMDLPLASPAAASETELREAEREATVAESLSEDRRRERQAVVHDLARAAARQEMARGAAEAIRLSEIEERVAAAQDAAGSGVVTPDSDSARMRHERAKARVSAASVNVELLAAGIPDALHKAEALGSALASDAAAELSSAEEEERRLQEALLEAESEASQPARKVSFSAQELQDAEQAAGRAEQELTDMRARAADINSKRVELRGRADRALGELETRERQVRDMDLETPQRELAKAGQELAGLEPATKVSKDEIAQADLSLESSNDALTACEGRLNELRGKLELVAGRVGLERLEEEQEAVQRAKEYAEEQESDYEASRHLLALLEAAETTRSSHLGRCLAAPVTERFLALTGDLYAHVHLDPDLRMEGFVTAGGTHRVEELSVGTREQLATIVRLAIAAQLKTSVLLDDQLVHSDSGRLEWLRNQVRNSVRSHDHQVIVMTCRLSDYAFDDEILAHEGKLSTNGPPLTIINILHVVRRVRAWTPSVPGC